MNKARACFYRFIVIKIHDQFPSKKNKELRAFKLFSFFWVSLLVALINMNFTIPNYYLKNTPIFYFRSNQRNLV